MVGGLQKSLAEMFARIYRHFNLLRIEDKVDKMWSE
jgi:hypothetical protein